MGKSERLLDICHFEIIVLHYEAREGSRWFSFMKDLSTSKIVFFSHEMHDKFQLPNIAIGNPEKYFSHPPPQNEKKHMILLESIILLTNISKTFLSRFCYCYLCKQNIYDVKKIWIWLLNWFFMFLSRVVSVIIWKLIDIRRGENLTSEEGKLSFRRIIFRLESFEQ